jgi:5-formyltetrahydrofolate cyclo-ligase
MKTKQAWRMEFQHLRHTLTLAEREVKSIELTNRYLELFQKERPAAVHLFLPIPKKAEVNTWMILKRLNEEYPAVKTVTSVVASDQQSLEIVEVRTGIPLLINSWGIPEPATRVPFPVLALEEVLTPLLAVDYRGYRLGYGKGFYDRFFETCSESVVRTGLNFFSVVTEDLPHDAWNVKLHR